MKYDYLIVGAGLFGATFARRALDAGKTCLVLEKRPHPGGNVYCEDVDGVTVHAYGAHIFHTNDDQVWDFVNSFCRFHDFIHSPVADYHGERYDLPFNMHTFRQMWGVETPDEARAIIGAQRQYITGEPENLEEQAIQLVGRDIYEKLIRHYTEKQWGRPCRELPPSIIRRLPVRFTYDNNYFNDRYQGIPDGGYNPLIDALLDGADVMLDTDYLSDKSGFDAMADTVVYSGTIDSFYGYEYGRLEYRSLRFETEKLPIADYQGNAVVNYTDPDTAYTRIIEHKHFDHKELPFTVITREYPLAPSEDNEPYYPIGDEKNLSLFAKYQAKADAEDRVFFGGRLAEYRYYDMDQSIASAFRLADRII